MTKSARAGLIKFERAAKPEEMARAIGRIQETLDRADDGKSTTVWLPIRGTGTEYETARAWVQVAFLLADTFDIDSQTLSELRHSILGVTQDALFG